MFNQNNKLIIVIPCFNEEVVFPETIREMTTLLERLIKEGLVSENSRILFVNDGSQDNTWGLISSYYEKGPLICGINLAKNV